MSYYTEIAELNEELLSTVGAQFEENRQHLKILLKYP
jgi:hypothetical protein